MTPSDLLALPDRELDARLAECLGVQPEIRWAVRLGCSVTYWPDEAYAKEVRAGFRPEDQKRATVERHDEFPAYTSPYSSRSLIEGVEAEIVRRGLHGQYTRTVEQLLGAEFLSLSHRYKLLTAPSKVRVAAAVAALEGGKE